MELPPPPFFGEEIGGVAVLPPSPRRLHPLSPVVRVGRATVGLLYVAVLTVLQSQRGGGDGVLDAVIVGVTVVFGVVSWLVTTWSVEGTTLEVASGLIRRQVVRVPLARVQAVDLVEPWLARIFRLAEVRVRTGGSGSGDARLQYLKLGEARAVRAALLALAHGLPDTTPAAPERPLLRVDNGRFLIASLLTGSFLLTLCSIGLEVALAELGRAILEGALIVYVAAAVARFGRRIANEWNFSLAESPDGLRITSGIGSRVGETIPARRIQAVHRVEPLVWRLAGWQRLELHLAGGVSRRRNQPSGVVRRALCPVTTADVGGPLVHRLLETAEVEMSPPPRRGWIRSPLSYHFLGAGHDDNLAVSSSGRICRRTELVPLAKVQSIHYIQGPTLRALGLATVRMHAAGRHATVEWRQWDAASAEELVAELTLACSRARQRASAESRPAASAPPPAGISPGEVPVVNFVDRPSN